MATLQRRVDPAGLDAVDRDRVLGQATGEALGERVEGALGDVVGEGGGDEVRQVRHHGGDQQ